jgi:hypothetical protein
MSGRPSVPQLGLTMWVHEEWFPKGVRERDPARESPKRFSPRLFPNEDPPGGVPRSWFPMVGPQIGSLKVFPRCGPP